MSGISASAAPRASSSSTSASRTAQPCWPPQWKLQTCPRAFRAGGGLGAGHRGRGFVPGRVNHGDQAGHLQLGDVAEQVAGGVEAAGVEIPGGGGHHPLVRAFHALHVGPGPLAVTAVLLQEPAPPWLRPLLGQRVRAVRAQQQPPARQSAPRPHRRRMPRSPHPGSTSTSPGSPWLTVPWRRLAPPCLCLRSGAAPSRLILGPALLARDGACALSALRPSPSARLSGEPAQAVRPAQ